MFNYSFSWINIIWERFQELDLSAENFLLNSSPLEALWAEHIGNTLKRAKHKYVMVII
jgi:hypothetical protein